MNNLPPPKRINPSAGHAGVQAAKAVLAKPARMNRLTCIISAENHKKLKVIAAEESSSVTNIVADLIQRYLKER